MKIAMIGLGKMGLNLVKNAADHDVEVVAFDLDLTAVKAASAYSDKITGVTSLDELLSNLTESQNAALSNLTEAKIIWLMLPAGQPTNSVIEQLAERLAPGDILIDGGNSNYKDNLAQNERLSARGIKFFDCGTSGGMAGARANGNFMIGGDDAAAWQTLEPLFAKLAQKDGYLYTGKLGSGHYLKMIHNGIEYGMMQAIAEGFELLDASQFDYDYAAVAKLWNHGSVIRSWLMELAQEAFADDAQLEQIAGRVEASGEGKWTVEEALDLQVPAPVIALSLMMRNRSLQDDTMTGKVVAALRNGFGGHAVQRKEDK